MELVARPRLRLTGLMEEAESEAGSDTDAEETSRIQSVFFASDAWAPSSGLPHRAASLVEEKRRLRRPARRRLRACLRLRRDGRRGQSPDEGARGGALSGCRLAESCS